MKALALSLLFLAAVSVGDGVHGPDQHPSASAADRTTKQNEQRVATIRPEVPADDIAPARAHDQTQQHRKPEDEALDLNRKAVDAAAQSAKAAWFTFFLSAFVGVPTLVAAGLAAYYSGRSARHARENIEALYEAERGILHAQGGEVERSTHSGELMVSIEFLNRGRAFAQIIEFGAMKDVAGGGPNSAPRWTFVGPGEVGQVPAFPAPAQGAEAVIDCWITYRSVGPAVYKSHFVVTVGWRDISYTHGLGGYIGWRVDVSNNRGHPDDT